MSTSAWRAPTTATSTPSARTPPSPTSASASRATPATGSTAKVGARHRHRSPADECQPRQVGGGRWLVSNVLCPCKKAACLPQPTANLLSPFSAPNSWPVDTAMHGDGEECDCPCRRRWQQSCSLLCSAKSRVCKAGAAQAQKDHLGLVLNKAGLFLTAGFPTQRLQNWVSR